MHPRIPSCIPLCGTHHHAGQIPAESLNQARFIEGCTDFLSTPGLREEYALRFGSAEDQVLWQRPAPANDADGAQRWKISTPDGQVAARFAYCTRADAQAAAARIAAALPGGAWPAQAGAGAAQLLEAAWETSAVPDLLPLTHQGKPDWSSGYGLDFAYFWMPGIRAAYERMITTFGRRPKNCRTCARTPRRQKKHGWDPNTGHWPS